VTDAEFRGSRARRRSPSIKHGETFARELGVDGISRAKMVESGTRFCEVTSQVPAKGCRDGRAVLVKTRGPQALRQQLTECVRLWESSASTVKCVNARADGG